MFWWICGLHVEREWMLVWISSLRMAAAIHHQVDPSSILQSIVIPSLYNQKTFETKAPAYTSPQQSTRFSFPSSLSLHFPKKGFWTFNVETFPPQLISKVALACRDRNKKTLAKHQTTQRTSIPSPNEIESGYEKLGTSQRGTYNHGISASSNCLRCLEQIKNIPPIMVEWWLSW